MTDPLSALLARLLDDAAAGLDAASQGVPVCVATKAGRPAPGPKYHEGRWAALNEVARRCRRTSEPVGATATDVRQSWADELARLTQRGAGIDWIAYREGGVEALDLLLGSGGPGGVEYTPGGILLESRQSTR